MGFAKDAPELVVSHFEAPQGGAGASERRYGQRGLAEAFGSLAAKDEHLAVSKLAVFRKESRDYDAIVGRVANSLNGAAFDRAITWLKANDPTGARDLEIATFEGSDPEKALALLSDVSPEGELDRRYLTVVRNWIHSEPGEAVAWANGLSDGSVKSAVLDTMARTWPSVDRVGAEGLR